MQMERERLDICSWRFDNDYDYYNNNKCNDNYNYDNTNYNNFCNNGVVYSQFCCNDDYKSNRKRTTSLSSSSNSCSPTGGDGGYIAHHVSKLDTLAGVAIKYGVEVADIKKMNGLVTDLQMFGRKTLHIPLPGRHPPSASLSNGIDIPGLGQAGFEQAPLGSMRSDRLDSFQSLRISSSQQKVSPAMSSLQGYYGLSSRDQKATEGCSFFDDGQILTSSASNPPLSSHRKCRSFASDTDLTDGDSEKWSEKLMQRRQSEADFKPPSPEMVIRKENNNQNVVFGLTGKGLSLRSKGARPTNGEVGGFVSVQMGQRKSPTEMSSGVRKSSSASSLHEKENSNSSPYVLGTPWSIRPDLPNGRRTKAARD